MDLSFRQIVPVDMHTITDLLNPVHTGLHIGAATLAYPGSLIFGGYDVGRIIGPTLEYSAKERSSVQLNDVVIGVELEHSPFPATSYSHLLSGGDESSSSFPAQVDPELPYIALPPPAIIAITDKLPVHYDPISKFYLWDTTDPKYRAIVSSPAYLGFVFVDVASINSNTSVTIKVPFKLLDLTLEPSVSGHS